jgi:hypothetical protein
MPKRTLSLLFLAGLMLAMLAACAQATGRW